MSPRPTIRDVAEQAGVSIATVSRVLNDRADVSLETRRRVREVARSVGYSADPAARALATQKTRLVAVVVGDNAGHRDLSLLFFGKVLAAISRKSAGILLLETSVSFGSHEAVSIIPERVQITSQSVARPGCRPTRPWLFRRLSELFANAYVPRTQPAHEDFPL